MAATAWDSLEQLPGLSALPCAWRDLTGQQFTSLKSICLVPELEFALSFPCPSGCGCSHRIIPRHDQAGALAACICTPATCPDISLTTEEATPLRVSLPKLGRAICKALALQPKEADLALPHTAQIGSWSQAPTPVILTIQFDPARFCHVLAELVARFARPFILLAPTSDHVDLHCHELLSHARSAFFALDSIINIEQNAILRARTPPAELFFTPERVRSLNPDPPPPRQPRYALTKGLGVWKLTFDGKEADLHHERGILYVAWLLYHPPEHPIHALDLIAKIPEIYRQQLGLPSLTDPITAKSATLESHARMQERSLSLDDAQTMRALYHKQKELEAILESDQEPEPVKAEALRELEAINQYQQKHTQKTRESAARAVDAVRSAMRRFHRKLSNSTDSNGMPHPVLRRFAAFLKQHILVPSSTYSRSTTPPFKAKAAGCLMYDPPPGIVWSTPPLPSRSSTHSATSTRIG